MPNENDTRITENDSENPGFKRLDFACDMADKYGLYLILDMRVAPGGQSGDRSCGKTGRNYLYYGEKISADYAGFADENYREIQKP